MAAICPDASGKFPFFDCERRTTATSITSTLWAQWQRFRLRAMESTSGEDIRRIISGGFLGGIADRRDPVMDYRSCAAFGLTVRDHRRPVEKGKVFWRLAPVLVVLMFGVKLTAAELSGTQPNANPVPWIIMYYVGKWIMSCGYTESPERAVPESPNIETDTGEPLPFEEKPHGVGGG